MTLKAWLTVAVHDAHIPPYHRLPVLMLLPQPDHRPSSQAHIAEVTAHCKDKHVIHCATTTDDMYASLDGLTDTLSRQLLKHKERKVDVKENRKRSRKEALNDEALAEAEE